MPQDINDFDPYNLGLSPLNEDTDDPFDLGLRPLDISPPTTPTYSHPMAKFGQGVLDFPEELYNYVNTLGREGSRQIMSGDYAGALETITSPARNPFKGLSDYYQNWAMGKSIGEGIIPSDPEAAKREGISQIAGLAGFPTERFHEAWEAKDYPRLAGQAAGGILTFAAPHMMQRRRVAGELPPPPIESVPHAPIESAPPPPPAANVSPIRDYTGQGTLDFGQPLSPKYTPPPDLPYRQELLPFDEPYQPSMNLGPYRGARGRFTTENPTWDLAGESPFVFPEQLSLPFTSETVRMEDFVAPSQRRPTPKPPVPESPVPEPVIETPLPIDETIGDTIPVPIDKLSRNVRVQMEQNGYTPTVVSNGNLIFKKRAGLGSETGSADPNIFNPMEWARGVKERFISDERGMVNFEDIYDQVRSAFRRFVNRDPSPEELTTYARNVADSLRRSGTEVEPNPPSMATRQAPFAEDIALNTEMPLHRSAESQAFTRAEGEFAESPEGVYDFVTDPGDTLYNEFGNVQPIEYVPSNEPPPVPIRRRPSAINPEIPVTNPEIPVTESVRGEVLKPEVLEPDTLPDTLPVSNQQEFPFANDWRYQIPSYGRRNQISNLTESGHSLREPNKSVMERYRAERKATNIKKIIDLSRQAIALEKEGDITQARALREEATELRRDISRGVAEGYPKHEELIERARQSEALADDYASRGMYKEAGREQAKAEALIDKVRSTILENEGQERLNFSEKSRSKGMGVDFTPEEYREAMSNVNPGDVSSLDVEFGRSAARGMGDGPPGLDVNFRPTSSRNTPTDGYYQITYRNSQGKPVAYASAVVQDGVGGTSILGIDDQVGLGMGAAIRAVGGKLKEINAYRPHGSYSPYTYRIMKNMSRFMREEGSTPIFTEGIGKVEEWFRQKYENFGSGQDVPESQKEISYIKEAISVTSGLVTTGDMSAGRQALPLINTPEFWVGFARMFKGLSKEGFEQIDTHLRSKEIFQRPKDPRTGKELPSIADKMGVKLMVPASKTGPKEEAFASKFLETGEWRNKNVPYLTTAWRNTVGKIVRPSSRAFITLLNSVRADRAEFLMDRARDMSLQAIETGKAPMPGVMGGIQLPEFMGGAQIGLKQKYSPQEAMNLNPYHNLVLAREIGNFVNTASGRGSLGSLESAADKLGYVLFSPRLLASRIRMINPGTYVMASPFVRKQYLKAAIGTAMGWSAFTGLAKLGAEAQGLDSEIVTDYTNADFGKFRIGDLRLDFGGGFLQWATLLGRAAAGGWTSSSNPEEGMHVFGEGYQPETQLSNVLRFGSNKLNPLTKFAVDWLSASEGKPFHTLDRTAQMFVNLFSQDLIETAQKNPELLPWVLPAAFGAGTQLYGRTRDYLGEGEYKFVPPEWDYVNTGGNIFGQIPDEY